MLFRSRGTIRNCSFTGSVNIEKAGKYPSVRLGGLVGYHSGELSDCRVRARMAVRGKDCNTKMGGIVATCGGTVRNCVFEGELSVDIPLSNPNKPRALDLGGIIVQGRAMDCRSRFSVSLGEEARFSTLRMGGIAASIKENNIENCLAEWTVSEEIGRAHV